MGIRMTRILLKFCGRFPLVQKKIDSARLVLWVVQTDERKESSGPF
jgi:hypothetical protein